VVKASMYRSWSRADTQTWIRQLETRIADIDYYLAKSVKWCEDNNVLEDERVFACSMLTCIWVSNMRDEPISLYELLEILGLEELASEDKIYNLDSKLINVEHEELLRIASNLDIRF